MKWLAYFSGLTAGVVYLWAPMARAQAPSPAGVDYFENKIRPILANNCYKCHSSQAPKLKGGLSVEFHDSLLHGGDTGPAIVPGSPDKSLLIKAVRYQDPDLQMPPKGAKLSDAQVADLTAWVRMGAPDPRSAAKGMAGAIWSRERRQHWAFQSIKRVAVPEVQDTNWVANPVDAFILAKLEQHDMKPNPPADRRTLIRRATYDLTGLPPTPEEVQAFLDDRSADAYQKVVDRLLASPQYGERWGRIWLDTARYADTKGDIKQNQDEPLYPYAWTYRDYVVRAFNQDEPYNRFVMEQLAADRMPQDRDSSDLAALGFLTLGPRFNGNKNDIINDRIDVVCKGFLGLTVTCARCHDHKFDPIPQKDYYSLRGIFDSCVEPNQEPVLQPVKTTDAYREYVKKINDLQATLSSDRAEMKGPRKNNPKNKELQRDENQIRRQIARLEMYDPGSPPCAQALYDSTKPHDSPVFLRGEADNQGDIAPRRFLEILSGRNRAPFHSGSGRLELAYSIVNPGNPLTPRVLVNRVWLHHFGQGFVNTPDDLGNQSEPPTHPELLDYLALHFMQGGWSIKRLHREIMLSSAYQQSSANNPRYAQADPQNHLLWRANIRRLDFEEIRDSVLALGGQLDLTTMGGPPVQLDLGEGGFSHRRTIYGMVDRRNLPEVYGQFDFANPDITTGKRYDTIVPQQALFMMNNPLVVELARRLVNGQQFQALAGDDARIRFLYERLYQREPTSVEMKLGADYIDDSPVPDLITDTSREEAMEQRNERKNPGPGRKKGARAMSMASLGPRQIRPIGAWVKYAHVLLQANEAIFIN
ncbi:MAG TPA: PSD1 and planctomycete cytochrome C domain-containing protein [Verrucomicrobiae bacterium]|jgi:mono/diheme cytochrome c family protein